jgi:single-strand DNA-binding protein
MQGRLTADPQFHSAYGSKPCFVTFCIANNNVTNGKEDTYFFNCVAFNKTAQIINDNLCKGQMIIVEGRIKIEPFVNKQGQNAKATQIIVDRMNFDEYSSPKSRQNYNEKSELDGNQQSFNNVSDKIDINSDEDLPF